MNQDRFYRQIILPEIGEAGQEKISKTSVLVIGAGGLGSPVLSYLCAAGIGRIAIVDNDTVSLSNLQRQILYDVSQVGLPKVYEAKKRLEAINPRCIIESINDRFSNQNAVHLFSEYDIAVDCTDNRDSRYLIDDTAIESDKPWVYGSVEGFYGQLSLFNYRQSGFSYRKLFPESRSSQTGCNTGVIGALPGIIGSMQALEVLRFAIGIPLLSGTLSIFDGINNIWSNIRLKA